MQLKNSSTKFCAQEQTAVRNIVVNLCCIFELGPQPITQKNQFSDFFSYSIKVELKMLSPEQYSNREA